MAERIKHGAIDVCLSNICKSSPPCSFPFTICLTCLYTDLMRAGLTLSCVLYPVCIGLAPAVGTFCLTDLHLMNSIVVKFEVYVESVNVEGLTWPRCF